MGDFLSRTYASRRQVLKLTIEDMSPWPMASSDYERRLASFHREDEAAARRDAGERNPALHTFCTCLECCGAGEVPNDKWQDDGNPTETETNDCPMCGGRGIVEVIDNPVLVDASDDEMPF